MGGFHKAKPVLHCIGKFIKFNDLFDTLTETDTFDVKTAEEIAGCTHYVRSSLGMLILSEALLKLKWNALWEKKLIQMFSRTFSLISRTFKMTTKK